MAETTNTLWKRIVGSKPNKVVEITVNFIYSSWEDIWDGIRTYRYRLS